MYEKYFQNQLLLGTINFQIVDFYQNVWYKLGSTVVLTLSRYRALPLCRAFCYCGQVQDRHVIISKVASAAVCTFSVSVTRSFVVGSFCSLPVTAKSLYHLQGLKKNWEEVHKEFQSLSVFIDSIPKKIRKQRLEKEMKQLEHDISIIEKHKIIYIANK